MQAVIRADHASPVYETKLAEGLKSLLPGVIEPIVIPTDQSLVSEPEDKSIAVLPFVNRSNDPNNEYLCDGIAEELITGLAKIDDLELASQLSSFSLKNQNLEAKEIGDRLTIANVITGSVQKAGERVRVSATLTECKSGRVLWSERYDGTLEDVFELQEDVANKVIDALKVELVGVPTGPLIDSGTSNAAAYQNFLLGKHEFLKRTRAGFVKAHEYFAASVAADPQFGRAYWYSFRTLAQQRTVGMISQEDSFGPLTRQLTRMKSTGYKPKFPDHWIERMLDPEKTLGEKSLAKEALDKLASNDGDWDGTEFMVMGDRLAIAGLWQGCLQFYEHPISLYSLDSQDIMLSRHYGMLLFELGRFDKAIDQYSDLIAREPQDMDALATRAMLYSRTGQYAKAEVDLAEFAKPSPRNFPQFYDLYWRRDLDAARAYFDWLDGQRNLLPVLKVWGCFLLGYIDKGMDYVEQSNVGIENLRLGSLYPLTPSMKQAVIVHPKYKAILAKEGLDDAWRDELMTKVNKLEHITGIRVMLDEDY